MEYFVVKNIYGQFSIWPAEKALPNGWSTVGERAPKDECLLMIETLWDDIRPRATSRAT